MSNPRLLALEGTFGVWQIVWPAGEEFTAIIELYLLRIPHGPVIKSIW